MGRSIESSGTDSKVTSLYMHISLFFNHKDEKIIMVENLFSRCYEFAYYGFALLESQNFIWLECHRFV